MTEIAPADVPAPEADAPGPADRCLNCGADRLGDYCHACGQHHLDDRLTLRVVWREFAERFLKLERGLVGTTLLALRDPGGLARRYVGGQRRTFVNPVSFLLLASAVAVLLMPLYASTERMASDPLTGVQDSTRVLASMRTGVEIAGGDWDALTDEQRAEIQAQSEQMQTEFLPLYVATLQQLYSVFSIALALALAGAYKLFFSGRKQTYTFAETVVVGCYVAGIYTALSAVIASALAPFAPLVVGTVVSTVLVLGIGALAATGFYGRTAGNAALGALSGLIALGVYLAVVVVVAIPLVMVRML